MFDKFKMIVGFVLVTIVSATPVQAQSLRDNEDLGRLFQQDRFSGEGIPGLGDEPLDQFHMADQDGDRSLSGIEYTLFMEDLFGLLQGGETGVTWARLSQVMSNMSSVSGDAIDPSKRMSMRVMFSMMDRDDNGVVSFSEYERSLPVLMTESDADQDGQLSRQEFAAAPERVILPIGVIPEDPEY